MTDRNDWGDRGERQLPGEGVRIIGAEEAQAALEAGAAIGRRSETARSEPSESGSGVSAWWPPPGRPAASSSEEAGSPEEEAGSPKEEPTGDFSSDFPNSFSTGAASAAGDWAGADWTWTGREEESSEPAEPPESPAAEGGTEVASDAEETDDEEQTLEAPGPSWFTDDRHGPASSPPPGGEPAGTGVRVPRWNSPLDHAEGISPSPSSWRPPAVWADSSPGTRSATPTSVPAPLAHDAAGEGHAPDETSTSTRGEGLDPTPGGSSRPSSDDATSAPSASSKEGIAVSGGFGTDLPHWTDPPTGEVPKLHPGSEEGEDSDDFEAWRAASRDTGVRWRDEADDWNDIGGIDELGSEETRVGDMDPNRRDPDDRYSFDEDFERLDEERSAHNRLLNDEYAEEEDLKGAEHLSRSPRGRTGRGSGRSGASTDTTGKGGGGRNLTSAVAVGIGLIVLLVVGYAVGSKALLVLSAAILCACSIEAFAMVQRRGFKPAAMLGVIGVLGVVFAAYWRGIEALSIVTAVMFVATMLWYLLGVVDARPLANVSASLMIYLWIGLLGSFAALLLRAPHGRGLFIGAVLPVVAADVVAYVIGSRIGSRTLAPWVSPGKTVEGVVAGGIAALVVGAVVGHEVAPWGGIRHGLVLGLVVAVLAPIGDLFESMIKRDLAVKDSGTALPGHGGLLDRFDSMLIVLPATYYLASLFNLHV